MYGPIFNSSSPNTLGVGPGTDNSSSPFSKPYATGDAKDMLSLSGGNERKKHQGFLGSAADFGKGIVKGAVGAVTSLFTIKGMLMALGTVALVAVAPAVAIPLLIASGVLMGGTQVAKGIISGDWEKAGEGTFTLGATMLGAKFGPKTVEGADDAQYAMVKKSTKKGVTTVSQRTGLFSSTWGNIKAMFGGKMGQLDKDGNIMTAADGKLVGSKTVYQIGKESLQKKFGSNKTQAANSATAVATEGLPDAVVAEKDSSTSVTHLESQSKQTETKPLSSSADISSQGGLNNSTGQIEMEVAKLKQLQSKLNGVDAESSVNRLKRHDIAELTELHNKYQNEVTGTLAECLEQLRKKYPDHSAALIERRHLARVESARKNFKEADLPDEYKTYLGADFKKGDKVFQQRLDVEEFESLHALRANPVEKFSQADQLRYDELKPGLQGQQSELQSTWFKGKSEKARHADIKDLLKKDPEIVNPNDSGLTPSDMEELKRLEEKYPHRSNINELNRQNIAELTELHNKRPGDLSEAETEQLTQLREKYPDHSKALVERRHIERVESARNFKDTDLAKNVKDANLPESYLKRWNPDFKKGDKAFQQRLDVEEFESLHALRANPVEKFSQADQLRYDELKQGLQGQQAELQSTWLKGKIVGLENGEKARQATIEKLLKEDPEIVNPTENGLTLSDMDDLAVNPKAVVNRIQELQGSGPLTETEMNRLESLEARFPHHSWANAAKNQDLAEMRTLQQADKDSWLSKNERQAQKQPKTSLEEEQISRLNELENRYPFEDDAVTDKFYLDQLNFYRKINNPADFDTIKVPDEFQSSAIDLWKAKFEEGDQHFQSELNREEFKTLKSLRGNRTYQFEGNDLARYNELETIFQEKLTNLEAKPKTEQRRFGKPVEEIEAEHAEIEANKVEIAKLKQLLEPQETINPSAQELMSPQALDQQIYAATSKINIPTEQAGSPQGKGLMTDQQCQDVADLKSLHQTQNKGLLNPTQMQRLEKLRKQYPDQAQALLDRRHMARIEFARKNYATGKASLPKSYIEMWEPTFKYGDKPFQQLLDTQEFESLKSLRTNSTEKFTEADQVRYDALKLRLQSHEAELQGKRWKHKNEKADQAYYNRLTQEDPEIVNPTIDVSSAKPNHTEDISGITASQTNRAASTTEKEANQPQAASVPEKKPEVNGATEKWYQGFVGPQGSGQIMATVLAGADVTTPDEKPETPGKQ